MKTPAQSVFDIRDFGARATARPAEELDCPARVHAGWKPGAHLRSTIFRDPSNSLVDGPALQAAIDRASEEGGEVRVPAGDYLIGPARLRSNVTLHLEAGAMLYATTDLEAYAASDMSHLNVKRGPSRKGGGIGRTIGGGVLVADNAENICLRGPGGISGQSGAYFLPWWKADKTFELKRPSKMIYFTNCRNIRISGLFIKDSPHWTLVFNRCRNVEIDGLVMDNQHGPNVDGIDIVDTSDVRIRHCRISTTDDAICLKSFDPEGLVENIEVSDCTIRTFCNGFKIGSEGLGTFRNIRAKNLSFSNNDTDANEMAAAIGLSATDGGTVENVAIRRVRASHGRAAFHISTGARRLFQEKFREPRPGVLRNIRLEDIEVKGVRHTALLSGLADSPLRDIVIDRCLVERNEAAEGLPSLPEDREAYPDPGMFGEPPSYGLFARHVEGLTLINCQWISAPNEKRPAEIIL